MRECIVCGSDNWIACDPGQEAEEQTQGNLFVLAPQKDIPARYWCASCHPARVVESRPQDH